VKYAISNIALPQYQHCNELSELASLGFEGLEVAPSRVWSDTWKGLVAADIQRYRSDVEAAGLEVVGLHSLLFDQPDLALCDSTEKRGRLMEFFVHLSGMCRDLGGRTIIWGGGRRREAMPADEALTVAVEFFGALADRIEGHGTVYCLEPLASADTDFVHSVRECQAIAHAVNRPGLKVQIDVKAMASNNELDADTISALAADLVHVHANEPGFEVLGSSGTVDHHLAGECLRGIGYDGYVSIEQKMVDPDDVFGPIRQSLAILRKAYA
jgi:sugar phosphate isomerase/epimerase